MKLKELLRSINEDHQYGEWWLTDEEELKPLSSSNEKPEKLMKDSRWKIIRAKKDKNIEIETWLLKPEDLSMIVNGIQKLMTKSNNIDDPDQEVEGDGYTGPRMNITIKSKNNKKYSNVPLSVLKKLHPSNMTNYQGKDSEPLNEDKSYHHYHRDYRLFEGNRHIIALFEDGSRLQFEVHFRNNRGEDKERWRRQAFSKWKSIANEIHSDVQLTEAGNPIEKSWKECFEEALKDIRLKEYIRDNPHQRVFPDKNAPVMDPVNFTQTG